SRNFCLTLWGIFIVCSILTGAFALSDAFAIGLQSLVFQQSGVYLRANLQLSFSHMASIWFLFACLCQYRASQWRFWQPYLLVLLLAIDLLVSGKHINKYAPPELYDRPPAVKMVSEVVNSGRLYKARNRNEAIMLTAPPPYDDYLWSMRWKIEILEPYAPLLYNIPFIFHSDIEKLSQKYVYTLTKIVNTVPWQQRLPFLSAAAVTAIITQEELALPGVHLIAAIPNKSSLKFYLYRNDHAVNRIAFISDWKIAASDGEALYTMSKDSFRPKSQVILQRPQKTFFMRPVAQSFIQELAKRTPQSCAPAAISQSRSGPSSANYAVTNACDGFLVFAEPYYPGWQVSVDQQPVPILRANYAFSAVYLKAGKHIVQRQYRPASLILGAAISLVFCCVIGIGMPARAWLRRSRCS
ncbi:MAG: YfhO family protein, partial [bacterium]|nr:YfhO family protein [bacterium]